MDEQTLRAFVARIIASTRNDNQARTMLTQLRKVLATDLKGQPEAAEWDELLKNAAFSVGELRQIEVESECLTREQMDIAKQRADERKKREEMYRGRC